jgi:hypothetical protein
MGSTDLAQADKREIDERGENGGRIIGVEEAKGE